MQYTVRFGDHIVRPLEEAEIESAAIGWRRLAEQHFGSDYFNLVDFIKQLVQRRKHRGTRLEIKFLPEGVGLPAKVSFNPLTLGVRVDVWRAAQNDKPWARWILAHECGHLILHDDFAKGFASEGSVRLPIDDQDRSAEWQADRFADYFLMPTELMERQRTPHDASIRFGVEFSHAYRRYDQVSRLWRDQSKQHDDQCGQCFNFSVARISSRTRCRICNAVQDLAL